MADGLLDNIGGVNPDNPTDISQTAQDIAKAQGVAYEDIAKEKENAAPVDFTGLDSDKITQDLTDQIDFKDSSTYIDDAKNTVAGQLTNILDSNSPYIKQQEDKAIEQASGRGLLNSSIASSAGRRAAIDAALPIAQQDAETYTKFGLQKQSAENQVENIKAEAIVSGEMVKQKATIDRKNKDIDYAFQARISGANEQSKAWLGDLQNTYNVALQNLDATSTQLQLQMNLDARQTENVANASSAIMQNYQVSVENMMTDPDFLNLGADAVNNAINQLQNLASNSIKFIGKSQGVDMDAYVDAYLSNLSVL